jgi:Fic family protein
MMLDATQNYGFALTEDGLFSWHGALFPTARSGLAKIEVGKWRTSKVEVILGQIGKEIVHFEGPPVSRVEYEMGLFLDWFNHDIQIDPVLKAGLSHLWFVTIHPFGDGNGRIGRAIADMQLARSERSPQRFYSLSSQIQKIHFGFAILCVR